MSKKTPKYNPFNDPKSIFNDPKWQNYQPKDEWSVKFAQAMADGLNAGVAKEAADRKAGVKPTRRPDAPPTSR